MIIPLHVMQPKQRNKAKKDEDIVFPLSHALSGAIEMLPGTCEELEGFFFASVGESSRLANLDGTHQAEPPMLKYDGFTREHMPSEKRMDIIFAGDPLKRTEYRDAFTEACLMREYSMWAYQMHATVRGNKNARKFYNNFYEEVREDQRGAEWEPRT